MNAISVLFYLFIVVLEIFAEHVLWITVEQFCHQWNEMVKSFGFLLACLLLTSQCLLFEIISTWRLFFLCFHFVMTSEIQFHSFSDHHQLLRLNAPRKKFYKVYRIFDLLDIINGNPHLEQVGFVGPYRAEVFYVSIFCSHVSISWQIGIFVHWPN